MGENLLIFLELPHISLKKQFPNSARHLLGLSVFGPGGEEKYGINFLNEMKNESNDFFLDNCVGDIIDTDDIRWYLLIIKNNKFDKTNINMINETNINYTLITIGIYT